ncbi:hypothetical protein GCM10027184_76170 [Saccharothrix stipae]
MAVKAAIRTDSGSRICSNSASRSASSIARNATSTTGAPFILLRLNLPGNVSAASDNSGAVADRGTALAADHALKRPARAPSTVGVLAKSLRLTATFSPPEDRFARFTPRCEGADPSPEPDT